MHVATHLAPALFAQLRLAVGACHVLVPVPDWRALLDVLTAGDARAAVVSPPADRGDRLLTAARDLLARVPARAVAVYAEVTPAAMRGTIELARRGVEHIVFRGEVGEARRPRDAVDQLTAVHAATLFLAALEPVLARSPAPLREAVRRLCNDPGRFLDVGGLAREAGTTRRTLDRWLAQAGLHSAHRLLVAARIAHAYHGAPGRDRAADRAACAAGLGYTRARLLADQVRLATGSTLAEVRAHATAEALAVDLAAWVVDAPHRPISGRRHHAASAPPPPAVVDVSKSAGVS